MLSNVISTGKEIASKLTNKILNLSEVEAKIKEATNDNVWGPSSSAMREIADETFSTANFHDVMTFLWYRIFSEKPVNGRRVHKGLVLLTYLIVNGSELVAISCKSHLHHINKLRFFNDQSGAADMLVRKKAADICELLGDPERLSEERKRAINYRTRSMRTDTQLERGSCSTWSGGRAQSLGNIDDWEPSSRSIPYAIGESFMNFMSTFTQNISGPPPTETHDNYDLPPLDRQDVGSSWDKQSDIDTRPYTQQPDQVSKCQTVSASRLEQPSLKINDKEITKPAVIFDAPIIDFAEPALDVNNNAATGCPQLSDVMGGHMEDCFGNLQGWTDDVNFCAAMTSNRVQPNSTGAAAPSWSSWPAPDNDFSADFKALSHRSDAVPQEAAAVEEVPKQCVVDTCMASPSKSVSKVGATWSELDKLNIDLNNLCNNRKRAFSKS